jgi:3-methyladenine DNA glycosylase/8-oxoguanine DNA glycosylase
VSADPGALGAVEVRVEVRPRWVFQLPRRGGLDGLTRVRAGVLHRVLQSGGGSVLVRVDQPSPERVVFAARAVRPEDAEWAIERMRVALGVDQDLRPFHESFRFDPLIGRAVRADPALRVTGKPDPFEALAWAICEQLIEFERAAAIERRIVARLGGKCPLSGLRAAPSAAVLARQAPALLSSLDLSAGRAALLVRVAREVAAGRIDLHDRDHEHGWRRLRAIRGIGSWTVQMLGLTGQGRLDQLPAADVGYLKLVGRLLSGDPHGRATEEEVAEFFSRFHPWAGLAGAYALLGGWGGAAAARMAG